MSSSKEYIVRTLKKEVKGREVPLGMPKICKHKFQAQNKLNKKLNNKLNFIFMLYVWVQTLNTIKVRLIDPESVENSKIALDLDLRLVDCCF